MNLSTSVGGNERGWDLAKTPVKSQAGRVSDVGKGEGRKG